MLLGESLLLALSGTLIGSLGAKFVFGGMDLAALTSGFLQDFYVTPGTLTVCALIGVVIGLLSAGVPAWRAARRPVVSALRKIA